MVIEAVYLKRFAGEPLLASDTANVRRLVIRVSKRALSCAIVALDPCWNPNCHNPLAIDGIFIQRGFHFCSCVRCNAGMKGHDGSNPALSPSSPSIFGHLGESPEIRACARDLCLRMHPESGTGGTIDPCII
jgi:hypothetical protein